MKPPPEGAAHAGQEARMYEYTIQEFNGSDADPVLAWLNENGEDGWEAFFMEPVSGGYRVWLKRNTSNVLGGLERSQR